MSCYKYWGTIEYIANKLSNYGDLDKYGDSALDNVDIDEIIEILDEVEIIAHDKEIDFDSAKHILDDEKMNKALQLIRKFYVYIGARLETENALKILESDNPTETLDSFHFYERYIVTNDYEIMTTTDVYADLRENNSEELFRRSENGIKKTLEIILLLLNNEIDKIKSINNVKIIKK